MNCPNCGTSNLDNASICINCGRSLAAAPPATQSYTPPPPASGPSAYGGARVPNYLVQSILVTFCCCLPFGIVAIIFAAQVNSKLAAGDYAGAVAASNSARKWCWVAFGVGLLIQALIWIFNGAMFLEGFREGFNS